MAWREYIYLVLWSFGWILYGPLTQKEFTAYFVPIENTVLGRESEFRSLEKRGLEHKSNIILYREWQTRSRRGRYTYLMCSLCRSIQQSVVQKRCRKYIKIHTDFLLLGRIWADDRQWTSSIISVNTLFFKSYLLFIHHLSHMYLIGIYGTRHMRDCKVYTSNLARNSRRNALSSFRFRKHPTSRIMILWSKIIIQEIV